MVFLQNPPDQKLLSTQFAWENTKTNEKGKRKKKKSLLYSTISDSLKKVKGLTRKSKRKEIGLIEKYAQDGNILDIGCANGGTLRYLHPKYVAYGIEPSPNLCKVADKYCRSTGGKAIQNVTIDALKELNDISFSCVLARSYLEHEIFVIDVCQAVYNLLQKDGVLIIKVPNRNCLNALLRGNNWPGVRHPDHVNYFSPKDMTNLLKRIGYDVIFPFSQRLPTSDNMWLIARKS